MTDLADNLRDCARAQAQSWLSSGALFLDTETTGLGMDAEIVEIAIIDVSGAVLLDTLVRPSHPIPPDATQIHGITDADVFAAPEWFEVQPLLEELVLGMPVVIYNAAFDRRLISQAARSAGLQSPVFHAECAMIAYAKFWQQWNDYRDDWKWQKLSAAAMQQGINVENAHRALGDCLMTLEIVRAMALENTDVL